MGKHKLYLDYRALSVEGVPEIPVHWQAKRVRFVLKPGYDGLKIGPFGSQLRSEMLTRSGYKVYGQENVIGHDFTLGERYIDQDKFDELSVYKIYPGDILITMMGSSGNCQIAPKDIKSGIMDSHLIRLRVRDVEVANRFFRLLIDAAPYVKHQIKLLGKGSIMHGLNSSIIKELTLVLPTRQEQAQILDFLDHETAKINHLISKQERLIGLLKEKRQAVISHAVTKGLNPDASMKDSGVEWLCEIPAHWEMTPVRGMARSEKYAFVDGDWVETPFITDDGVRLIQTGNIGVGEYREQGFRYISEDSFVKLGCTEVFPGDILICRLADPVGRACAAPDLGSRMITSVDVCILRPSKHFCGSYLVKLMSSKPYLSFMESQCRGGTRDRISRSFLGGVRLPMPPLEEQIEIDFYLSEQISKIDLLVSKVSAAIDLLKEHRTALISAAVTGKIDVRGWQKPSTEPQEAATAASA